ncbi:major facilitator superfamily domain-containing protein [Aspergillus insuetus]
MIEESTPLLPSSPPPARSSSIRNILFACLPMVALTAADGALILAAYPTLGSKLHHLNDVAWCMISYQIGVILGQSIYSRLSDTVGRREVMLWAHCIFVIGVICQSFAPGFWFITAARAIAGLGTAGMPLMVNTILNDISGEGSRGVWGAFVQTASALGQFLGGVCGGYILDKLGWQTAFLFELGYAAWSLVTVWWFLSPPPRDRLPTPFNIPGAVALALCLGSLVSLLDSDHFGVVGPSILVFVFALALYWTESRAEASLVPWQRLGDSSILYVLTLAPITAVTDMSVRSTTAGLVLAGLSSGLANGTSITMIMRYTKRRRIESERSVLYGAYHLIIAIGNLFSHSVVSWLLRYNVAREIRVRLGRDYPGDINKIVKGSLESFDYIDRLPDWTRSQVLASFLQTIHTCFVYVTITSAIGAIVSVLCGYRYPNEREVEDPVER